MDSDVVMFRRPLDTPNEHQVFVYHSPIEKIDQQLVVYRNPSEVVVFRREYVIFNNLPDYNSPTKRSFLNECIRQVYLLNGFGNKLHFDTNATVQCSREELLQQVDLYTQPERLSPWKHSLNRCKRQLFRQSQQVRKPARTRRNPCWGGTEAVHLKPVRHLIRRQYIRRGFLNPVRRITLHQMLREALDEQKITQPEIRDRVEGDAEHIAHMDADTITSLTERAKRMDAAYMHERMRLAVEQHRIMMEESVRSIMYARQLYQLITRNEEGQLFSSSFC